MIGTKNVRDMDKDELWNEYKRVHQAVDQMRRDLGRLKDYERELGLEVDARAGIDEGYSA